MLKCYDSATDGSASRSGQPTEFAKSNPALGCRTDFEPPYSLSPAFIAHNVLYVL
jgi:hypothetical protein